MRGSIQFASRLAALTCGVLCGLATLASGQDARSRFITIRTQPPETSPADDRPFRKLAPGVERTIDPELQQEEAFSWHAAGDVLKADPQYGERPWSGNLAKEVRYEHDVWALEFTFKPVRFIEVDVPRAEGKFDRTTVWYMCYRVQNLSDQPVRFIPRFLLHSWDNNKFYPDRFIPVAVDPIRRREDARRTFLNSVEISGVEIPPVAEGNAGSVWGVVTWEGIDPATDRFSIYIQGLTNAYRWEEQPAGASPKYLRKTLQLNFWRPGDGLDEQESEIRFGIPEDVDYRWVYK